MKKAIQTTEDYLGVPAVHLKSKQRHFIQWSFLAFMTLVGFVATVNYFVDPYDVLHNSFGLLSRDRKPLVSRHLRLVKAADVINRKPEAIVLGSSRILLGFDVLSLKKTTGIDLYNLGLAGCTFNELFAYFQHVLANNPNLKHVTLGIDLFAFNARRPLTVDFSQHRLGSHWLAASDYTTLLCTNATFRDSLKTLDLKGRWSEKDSFGTLDEAGFLLEDVLTDRAKKREANVIERDRRILDGFYSCSDMYGTYELSKEAVTQFSAIVEICRQKGITLQVFIPPCRTPYWHALYLKDHWASLKALRAAVTQYIDVWDFSGVNAFTEELYDQESPNYIDVSHFRPHIGAQLFALMNHSSPESDSYLITQATLVDHEQKLEEKQLIWADQHPEWDHWIRENLPTWSEKALKAT